MKISRGISVAQLFLFVLGLLCLVQEALAVDMLSNPVPQRWFQVPGNVKSHAPPYWTTSPATACNVVGTNIAAYGTIKSIHVGTWPDQNVWCDMDFYDSDNNMVSGGTVGIANNYGCLRSTVYDVGLESIRDWDPTTNSCWFPGDRYAFRDVGSCSKCEEGKRAVGDPINAGTGNNIQQETDYQGSGPFPLMFERFYNSATVWPAGLGYQWRHTYDRSLHFSGDTSLVSARRPDGRVFYFSPSNGTTEYRSDNDIADRIYKTAFGWTYNNSRDEIESYNATGKLLSIQNRAGLLITLGYDGSNRLTSMTDSFGRKLTLIYDASDRIITLQDPANQLITYGYDGNNNLSTVTYPDGGIKAYLHEDSNHPFALTGIVDENGKRFANFSYDAKGRAQLAEHAGGALRVTLGYNSDGTTIVTDALGAQRTYSFWQAYGVTKNTAVNGPACDGCGIASQTSYDSYGRVAEQIDFNGVKTATYRDWRGLVGDFREGVGTAQYRQTNTDWHPTFRLPQAIYEPGRNTQFQYDTVGNLLQKTTNTNGQSQTWGYTYNTAGQVLTADGPRTDVADITTYSYDAQGNLVTIKNALDHITQLQNYDAHGHVGRIIDPNGLITDLTYDKRGRVLSRKVGPAAGPFETTSYDYDKVGQLIKVTLPNGTFIAYTYDDAHRLTQVQDQLSNRIVYTLDAMGNRIKEEHYAPLNALTHTQTRVYDVLNRLRQTTGGATPSQEAIQYSYDNNGNVISTTDLLGHTTNQIYDGLNRLTQTINPNNGVTQYGYTALDQITTVTDPRNLTTNYAVNGLDSVTQTQSPDTGTTQTTVDAVGNIISKTDAKGQTTQYQYDALNRLIKETRADNSTVIYTYDTGTNQKGRLTGMTDASGSTSWTYDLWGRVTEQSQVINGTTRTTKYAYDATGQLTSLTYPSGNVINYGWTSGHVTSVKLGSTNIANQIVYQPFGPVKSWMLQNGEIVPRTFDLNGRMVRNSLGGIGYDAAGRVITAYGRSYGYDNLDRLTSYQDGAGTYTYSWDATGNRTQQTVGSTLNTYAISPSSNRIQSISAGTVTISYTHDANGSITSDGTLTFTYDSAGRLVQVNQGAVVKGVYAFNGLGQRVKKVANGATTLFAYDGSGKLLGEYNGTAPIQETVWLGDIPIATIRGGTVYYIHADHLNTPKKITDGNQKVRWLWDAPSFGATDPNENPSNLGAFVYNLAFPGQYRDKETGLYYNYFRDYDPKTGRYLQSDPIGLAGGINTYAYVNGNPLSYVDPTGLDAETLTLVAGGSAAAGGFALTPAGWIGTAALGGYAIGTAINNRWGDSISVGVDKLGNWIFAKPPKDDNAGESCDTGSKEDFWKKLKPFRGKTKTNGESGKNKRYFEWDYTHGDVEVYDRNGKHLGTADPQTGEMIKPPVPGREFDK